MKAISFKTILEDDISGERILKSIERYGRTCCKSEDKTTESSTADFVNKIIELGHEAVLEHK